MLLGAVSFSSCADQNDWDVDSSFDRLFHTTSLSVSPDENSAEITFDKTPNTTSYQVEYSTEELNDEMELGTAANSQTATLTTTPYISAGLNTTVKNRYLLPIATSTIADSRNMIQNSYGF